VTPRAGVVGSSGGGIAALGAGERSASVWAGEGSLGTVSLPDFAAVDFDLGRGVNSEADLVALEVDDGDDDVVTNHNLLVSLPGKD
jgi:hypothetical protein